MRKELPDIRRRIHSMKQAVSAAVFFVFLDTNDDVGGNLNAASRQALMQKLARIEPAHQPEPMSVFPSFRAPTLTVCADRDPTFLNLCSLVLFS